MQVSILQKEPDSDDLFTIRLLCRALGVIPDEASLAFRVLTHSVAALKRRQSAPGLDVEAWLKTFVILVLECETAAETMATAEVAQEQYLGGPVGDYCRT